jgi:hypothetical protein
MDVDEMYEDCFTYENENDTPQSSRREGEEDGKSLFPPSVGYSKLFVAHLETYTPVVLE